MITARVRRSAVSLLAAAAVVVTPSVFLLLPAAAAGAVITVLQSQEYVDSRDGAVIIGELQNTGTGTTGLVAVDVTWWSGPNGTGTSLGSDSFSSTLQRVPTGSPSDVANRSPFRGLVSPPPGQASYTLTATPSDPLGEPNHNFAINITSQPSDPVDSSGLHHIVGTITNQNTSPASDVNLVVTMYDGSAVVDDAVGFISGASTSLDSAGTPGAVGHFDLASEGSGHAYTGVAAIAESSSAAAPAASPSPSATSPGASPSATATSSPAPSASSSSLSPSPSSASPTTSASSSPSPTTSASSSPSPTTSAPALPCRPGGGTFAITTTPSYAKIVKGGRVRLNAALTQADRACQPGVRLSVYVRGPGTTLYHLSRTLTTGSTGKAFADYAGVKADFRWYVRSSGAHSAIDLVQAR